jgi:serine protease Do
MKRFISILLVVVATTGSSPVFAQSISDLFDRVKHSVVVITTEETDFVTEGEIRKVSRQGLGSGVLIEGGLILTAAHVVQTANLVMVKFYDGQEIFGRVIGSSPQADVAIVVLDSVPKDVPELPLGNSDGTRTGDDIIVVGAPYGLAYTLTKGIVSGRSALDQNASNLNEVEFFQTDASINQGNSGGPMFDMDGKIIGIVSSILTQSGGFEGIGFAATANIAKSVLLDKKAFWWGVDGTMLEGGLARLFNVPQDEGYLIKNVADDSPGARLGLIPSVIPVSLAGEDFEVGGDIVLSIQGIEFGSANFELLQQTTNGFKKGDQIRLTVLRGGQVLSLATTY